MFFIMNLILAASLSNDIQINNINISKDNIISIDIVQEKSSLDRREEIKNLYDHIPMNPDHVCYTVQLCSEHCIDPDIIFALIEVESKYNPIDIMSLCLILFSAIVLNLLILLPLTSKNVSYSLN